jgi:ferritin-like metal-binding protein YciE
MATTNKRNGAARARKPADPPAATALTLPPAPPAEPTPPRRAAPTRRSPRAAEPAAENLDQLRRDLQTAQQTVEAVRQQAHEVMREVRAAEETLQRVRPAAEETARSVVELQHRAQSARHDADAIRADLDAAGERLAELRTHGEAARLRTPEPPPPVAEPRPAAPVPATALPPPANGAVVYAVTRVEAPADRLVRYLNEAYAAEAGLAESMEKMAGDSIDPEVRSLFEAQRGLARQQEAELAARLKELKHTPSRSAGKGFFGQLFDRIGGMFTTPTGDDLDKTVRHLIEGYAQAHAALALYQALEAYAVAVGDSETAALAARHREQERAAAEQLWPLIAPSAVRAARVTAEAHAEVEQRAAAAAAAEEEGGEFGLG